MMAMMNTPSLAVLVVVVILSSSLADIRNRKGAVDFFTVPKPSEISDRTGGNQHRHSDCSRRIKAGNLFRHADIPSRLMILMAIRVRLPLGTGFAPTIGVGVCLLVLHSRTAD
jgi:hypothetical protein